MSEQGGTTKGVEEYVEAIWRVTGAGPASTKALAEHLHVAPASVTGMLKRLAALGLVKYRPYGKASLTIPGMQLASEIIRRHRLSERLLTDILGMPWEKAHAEACKFDHLITGEVEERLTSLLGSVDTCPHGNPLDPTTADANESLADVQPPAHVRVSAVLDESDEFLRYLTAVGVQLGTELTVCGTEPFSDGALLVEISGQPRALARRVAEQIRITSVAKGPSRRKRTAKGMAA